MRTKAWMLAAGLVLATGSLVGACTSTDADAHEDARAVVIGPGGGTVASADGLLSVTIPPGALDADVTITVRSLSNVPNALRAYELGPSGTEFAEPVTVTARYKPAAPEPDLMQVLLAVREGEALYTLDSLVIDTDVETVSGTTTHFSEFHVVHGVIVASQVICARNCPTGYYPMWQRKSIACEDVETHCVRVHERHRSYHACGGCTPGFRSLTSREWPPVCVDTPLHTCVYDPSAGQAPDAGVEGGADGAADAAIDASTSTCADGVGNDWSGSFGGEAATLVNVFGACADTTVVLQGFRTRGVMTAGSFSSTLAVCQDPNAGAMGSTTCCTLSFAPSTGRATSISGTCYAAPDACVDGACANAAACVNDACRRTYNVALSRP